MKTLSTFITLALIISICALSAILYLNEQYGSSAVLSISWIISITLWIKANGFLENKQRNEVVA